MAEQALENAPIVQQNGAVAEPAGKKKSKKMLLVLIAVPVVAALAFLLVVKVVNPRLSASAPVEKEKEPEGAIWELGTKLANPMGTRGSKVMKVSVSLEVSSEGLVAEIEKKRKRLEDRFLTILTSKTLDDISSPEGKAKLKDELKQSFTSDLGLEEGEIRRVYFGEFVIQ